METQDIAKRRDALTQLQALQPRVFGAEVHRFRLNPIVAEKHVAAFERLHKISLPPDYRHFITDLGNGGAGPFYGVFPLGRMDDTFGLRSWQSNDGIVGVLSEPFPHETQWNDLSGMPGDDGRQRDEAGYDGQMNEFDSVYWNSSLVNGAIPICHEGCALRLWLVVTGNQAGYLWEDKRAEYAGLTPVRLVDGSLATFFRWYDAWLESCFAVATG